MDNEHRTETRRMKRAVWTGMRPAYVSLPGILSPTGAVTESRAIRGPRAIPADGRRSDRPGPGIMIPPNGAYGSRNHDA